MLLATHVDGWVDGARLGSSTSERFACPRRGRTGGEEQQGPHHSLVCPCVPCCYWYVEWCRVHRNIVDSIYGGRLRRQNQRTDCGRIRLRMHGVGAYAPTDGRALCCTGGQAHRVIDIQYSHATTQRKHKRILVLVCPHQTPIVCDGHARTHARTHAAHARTLRRTAVRRTAKLPRR